MEIRCTRQEINGHSKVHDERMKQISAYQESVSGAVEQLAAMTDRYDTANSKAAAILARLSA